MGPREPTCAGERGLWGELADQAGKGLSTTPGSSKQARNEIGRKAMGGSLRPGFRRQSVSLSLQVCTVTSITRLTGSLIKLANILGMYSFFLFFF